jgi:HTH-type transcriptional regulator/antitoxin HigA
VNHTAARSAPVPREKWLRRNGFLSSQVGISPRDLIPYIGSRNRVSEILNRKRPLTLKMVWRLHTGLGIPADSLIRAGAP